MAAKIVETHSILSIEASINATNTYVSCPSDWHVIPVDLGIRICNSFDECSVPFYGCLFTRIGLQLPLYEFEMTILKYLKVSPSQIHLGS